MATFPDALPARQGARRRWRVALLTCVGIAAVGAVTALVAEIIDLPDVVVWTALVAFAGGLIGVFIGALGLGWTAGLRWYQSLWWALKMTCAAIRELL